MKTWIKKNMVEITGEQNKHTENRKVNNF